MALPKKIKVGSQDWTVVERSRKEDLAIHDDSFGYTLSRSNLIVIDKDAPISRKRQTLFHELFHAVRYSVGSSGIKPNMEEVTPGEVIDVWEHYFIAMYEDTMLAVMRENPALVKFLLEKDA